MLYHGIIPVHLHLDSTKFQIIDHGFLQGYFKAKQSTKNTNGNIAMYINKR
jgi:hypothetical protein